MLVREIVYARENELRLNHFETAFAVDVNGNIVLEKVGAESGIVFTDEEIERLRVA